MNAELLAMLGGAGAVPSRREAEPKTLLSFKAGKMNAERQEVRFIFCCVHLEMKMLYI